MVTQLTAPELAERLENTTLIDTRQAESFENWHIAGAENIPFDPTEGFDDTHLGAVDEVTSDGSATIICGKGLTSAPFGIHLENRGYDGVSIVQGGMEAWSELHEVVEVGSDDVRIYQLQRRATGCLSYVIADAESGEALVVDPTRQTEQFELLATEEGLELVSVLDTHVHADHLSGGAALAERLNVPYHIGAIETEEHEYRGVAASQSIDNGDTSIEPFHAPGHTEEMLNLVVDEEFLLTADTLFLDSVGRTELGFEEGDADRGAEMLYETLHDVVLELDAELTVLPGHVSITDDIQFEFASPGEPIRARLGELIAELELLGLDREEFIDRLTSDLPDQPSDYETIIEINSGRRAVELEAEAAELDTGANNCSA